MTSDALLHINMGVDNTAAHASFIRPKQHRTAAVQYINLKTKTNMKSLVLVVCLAAAVLAEEKYDATLDKDFQISDVLNNDRLLLNYTKCLLDKGPCTPEVRQVKGNCRMHLLQKINR